MAVSSRRIGAALVASRYVLSAGFGLALGLGSLTASAQEAAHRSVELSGAPTRAIGDEAMPGPTVAMQSATTSLHRSAAIAKSATSLRPVAAVINNEAPLRPTAALRNGTTSLRPVAAIIENGPVAGLANGQTSLRPVAAIVSGGAALRPVAALSDNRMSDQTMTARTKSGTAHQTSMRVGAMGQTHLRTTSIALTSHAMGKALATHSTLHWAKQHSHMAH
jgi:hypothetical protein